MSIVWIERGFRHLADVVLAYFQGGSVQMFLARCFVPPVLSFLNFRNSWLFPVAGF